MDESLLEYGHEPLPGAHLVTQRTFYTHHGIYTGNGRVIHYAGLAKGWWRGPVEDVSLERFARGHGIRILDDPRRFDRSDVVARARSRLGERRYRILTNNCEHFCAWALRGEIYSEQVERALGAVRRLVEFKRRFAGAVRHWWRGPRASLPVTEGSACRLW
jgi:hypothetical protein